MNHIVKDSMVPISEYPTISEEATLQEALLALENAKADRADTEESSHWIVLILNNDGKVVGKLSQLDVLTALEAKNEGMTNIDQVSQFGFSSKFITELREEIHLQSGAFDKLYADPDIMTMRVGEIMISISEKDFIDEETSLATAAHQMASRKRLSMLVTREDEVIGVLRLSDVFAIIIQNVKTQQ